MKSVYFVVGARPQFIKAAPVLEAMKAFVNITVKLIHTGQHYDYNLSELFFQELKIPTPDYQLNCGSGTSVEQYISILQKLSEVLRNDKPDMLVVFGDTNSTGAAALCSNLMGIKLAHIESGLREFDKNIPEEINKVVTDALSDLYFCPTQTAVDFLNKSNVSSKIILSGDPVLDLLFANKNKFENTDVLETLNLEKGKYIFATCHRQNNTNNKSALESILKIFAAAPLPVLFPLHPRTKKAIVEFDLSNYLEHTNIHIIEPIGFWETQSLIANCDKVLTDSGGVIKEAYFHGKYVIVLDKQTEWVEVINEERGLVCGPNYTLVIENINNLTDFSTPNLSLGSGNASAIIANAIALFITD
ncbi:MAG: UDP-N-acetylglucosamine 2-epimerase (non-hydrolyzing) [Saprospiraceae bacterium]|uniref:non-hydrolyzing UDP-N-acetylglucosamine 2-epimerase n=1 Tax=Candidatus Brachybacter algidus TaxID=2982024 RepID=UPI001DCF9425|nr:UDP-N-acetylglucosamine 2-epimerase (non-hydrolyzing) [Candidatus Brachybacter algidus]MBK6450651.1 UDP-N-acetylglucosamine 2-epimerase (non-hydrolyzing) [Candidatus Brachybacter algidus]MBK8842653.1 UDP-N-acetylglucosamine 2-epimerase (non-hydrolyzing) [Candidatus Brachybacter algidus]MBK9022430.1 UDP-N-acetylglucosamine 2-epimerase (non-hydrolyzing) [Candidatus Brachybacter algidus]